MKRMFTSRKLAVLLLQICFIALFASASMATTMAVVPNQYATVEAPGEMSEPVNTNMVLSQYVFDKSYLSALSGQYLTGLTFRLDRQYDGDTTARNFSDYTIQLGSWTRGTTFSNVANTNIGNAGNAQTVRTGAFIFVPGANSTTNAPNAFGNFMKFDTPYLLDGANDLLVTLYHGAVTGGNHTFVSADSFADGINDHTLFASSYSQAGNTYWSWAPVIEFTTDQLTADGTIIHSAPVPEPSTILLLGIGMAGIVAARKRSSKK